MAYRDGLDRAAKSQIKQVPYIPDPDLTVDEAEDLRPQPLQVVLFSRTGDNIFPYVPDLETLEDLGKMAAPVDLEDFPTDGWLGDSTATI